MRKQRKKIHLYIYQPRAKTNNVFNVFHSLISRYLDFFPQFFITATNARTSALVFKLSLSP